MLHIRLGKQGQPGVVPKLRAWRETICQQQETTYSTKGYKAHLAEQRAARAAIVASQLSHEVREHHPAGTMVYTLMPSSPMVDQKPMCGSGAAHGRLQAGAGACLLKKLAERVSMMAGTVTLPAQ